jgi:hypothetical protein
MEESGVAVATSNAPHNQETDDLASQNLFSYISAVTVSRPGTGDAASGRTANSLPVSKGHT